MADNESVDPIMTQDVGRRLDALIRRHGGKPASKSAPRGRSTAGTKHDEPTLFDPEPTE